jgi:glycosyltransferase involved in cell wall biosynthesis
VLRAREQARACGPSNYASPSAVMLVPHEPSLDPRVQYTAASLAKRYKLRVIGTVRANESPPEGNACEPAYKTIRLAHSQDGIGPMVLQFLGLVIGRTVEDPFSRSATILSNLLLSLFVATAIPVASVVLLLELLLVPLAAAKYGANLLNSPMLSILPAVVRRLSRLSPRIFSPIRLADDRLSVLLSTFRFTFGVNRTIQDHLRQDASPPPSIVYCHDLYTMQTAVVLKRRTGCKIIYDSHEYYPDQWPDPIFAWVVRLYESRLVRSADVYITVSPSLAEELQRLYKVPRVHPLPNVEPRPLTAPRPNNTMLSALARSRLKVLYQGAFAQDRGLEEVLHEWRDVDADRAALFLRGPRNEARDRLEALAGQYGLLNSSVFILPPVLEADLIAGASEADVGLIPYKTDRLAYRFACPNKLSQYIHAGVAVVSNRLPFVEKVVEGGRAGLCYDINVRGSLAQTINALASDRKLLASLKGGALVLSSRGYNWESYETVLLELCASLETS